MWNKIEKTDKKIPVDELIRGCFSRVESVRAGKFRNGVYIVRYAYRCESNFYGDQLLWILYTRRSMKRIRNILNYIDKKFEEWNGKVLIVDDFDPAHPDIAFEVNMLGDGYVFMHTFEVQHGGEKRNIGVIVGQGRELDLDDKAMMGCIHVILANALGRLAKRDRFISAGVEKLRLLEKEARKLGLKPRYVKVNAYGRVDP